VKTLVLNKAENRCFASPDAFRFKNAPAFLPRRFLKAGIFSTEIKKAAGAVFMHRRPFRMIYAARDLLRLITIFHI
jgi:hypothetical protein